MRISICIVLLVVMGLVFTQNPPKARYDNHDVFVYDGKLIVESKEFYIKGFNYSPQPLGMQDILGQNGGGLCSQKKNEEGVLQSACFLEDYFNGIVHPDFPSHGPWFKQIWDRDFKMMKDMGVNAIRVYHMNHITKSLIDKYPEFASKYNKQYAAEHTTFFDVAESYGIKVICPVIDQEALMTADTVDNLKKYAEARVDEVGNHPALIMWAVGNEWGLHIKPELSARVNIIMDHLREYTLQKWNRVIPVTTFEVDLPNSYIQLLNDIRVDVFSSNCGYRDVFINSIWEPDLNPDNNMPGFDAITKATGIPLLVGEFGMHEQDRETAARPDWVNQQIRSMLVHKKNGGIGYLYFEWNEEHLKPPNQQDMGVVKFTPAKQGTKDSTMSGVLLADIANEKPVVFKAAKSGLSSSPYRAYSFSGNPYTLTATTQLTVDLSTITPKPFRVAGSTLPVVPFPTNYVAPEPLPLQEPGPEESWPTPQPTEPAPQESVAGSTNQPSSSNANPITSTPVQSQEPIPRESNSAGIAALSFTIILAIIGYYWIM